MIFEFKKFVNNRVCLEFELKNLNLNNRLCLKKINLKNELVLLVYYYSW
jgi:hypothetical protein